jgi:hypothetical protein
MVDKVREIHTNAVRGKHSVVKWREEREREGRRESQGTKRTGRACDWEWDDTCEETIIFESKQGHGHEVLTEY